MDLGLSGRVALVTGSSRGVGRATAELFAREGASIGVTYCRGKADAEAVESAIVNDGGQAAAVHLDLSDCDSIRAAVAVVLERWGRIDILVNNAVDWPDPTVPPVRFEHITTDQWQRLIPSNVHGPFAAVQAVLPSMRQSQWGRIVNVSSVAAEEGMQGFGWYAVAKASLQGLTRTLARELSAEGILTNTVMPGPTFTDRIRANMPVQTVERWAAKTSMRRLPMPDEIARTIVFLCSAANTSITGETIRTGGRPC